MLLFNVYKHKNKRLLRYCLLLCVINIIICCIIILYIYLIIYRERTKVNRASQSRRASRREGRERTRAKDDADLFARSSPLFCSVCCLHCPHHRQPLTPSPARNIAKGEGRTVTPSASGRCHHHTSPATRRAAPRQSAILPASSSSPSPLPGCEGRAASKPGRAILSRSSCRPSPPCRGASAYWRTPPERGAGSGVPYQGGAGRLRESLFRDFFYGCIALNINYLFSPKG